MFAIRDIRSASVIGAGNAATNGRAAAAESCSVLTLALNPETETEGLHAGNEVAQRDFW